MCVVLCCALLCCGYITLHIVYLLVCTGSDGDVAYYRAAKTARILTLGFDSSYESDSSEKHYK